MIIEIPDVLVNVAIAATGVIVAAGGEAATLFSFGGEYIVWQ